MKNPCDDCLVKACCSKQCNEKDEHIEYIIWNELKDICKLIDETDHTLKKNIPKEVRKKHKEIRKLCNKVSNETTEIFKRYIKFGIKQIK
jgi:hypothetical protein